MHLDLQIRVQVHDSKNLVNIGLNRYIDPQPEISAFREASFGHGEFEVMNATYARWTWHRNDDDEAVVADSIWLTSLASDPTCKV